jgi:MFS family permease
VEASSILSRFHANNGGEHDPLVVFEMAEIQHAIRIEKEIHAGSSWLCLVATPGNRKRMMIVVALAVFSQWSGNDLVSYYLHLILEGIGMTNPSTQAAINGGLQVFNLVAAMIGSFLVDRLGRRTLFIISNTGMLISFLAWTITTALFNTVHGDAARDAAAKATIPFIFVFFFFYDIGYTPMVVAYMIEILPYNIRARGFVVMGGVVCLVQAVNQFINPWVLDAMGWKYYLVYCVWLMLELAFILKYIIETKGRTLEETAALFDSEAPSQDLVQRGGEAATITVAPVMEDPFKKSKLQFGTFGTFGMLEGSPRVTKVEFHELKLTTTESTIYRSKFTNS